VYEEEYVEDELKEGYEASDEEDEDKGRNGDVSDPAGREEVFAAKTD
jgi:hypothetical protein